MGRAARLKPERLPEKLLQIRLALGLSQSQIVQHLGLDDVIYPSNISGYETGEREPPLPILLRYARAANVYLEAVVDDELDLPATLPSPTKSEGVKRKAPAPKRKRR
ncbi:MAG TPA: helix-turn-helix transcriptional regulator [Pyrinomonadaceae bacterium]